MLTSSGGELAVKGCSGDFFIYSQAPFDSFSEVLGELIAYFECLISNDAGGTAMSGYFEVVQEMRFVIL